MLYTPLIIPIIRPAAQGLHHDAVGRRRGIQLLLTHLLEEPHAADLVAVPRVGIHHTW